MNLGSQKYFNFQLTEGSVFEENEIQAAWKVEWPQLHY